MKPKSTSLTQFDGNRDLGQLFEDRSYGDTRVVTGPTSDEEQPPAPPDHRKVGLQPSEGDGPAVEVDSSTHSVDDRLGLLVNLLLHKVVELTLHDLGELDLESLDGSDGGESVVLSESVDMELCATWPKSASKARNRYRKRIFRDPPPSLM